jgi:hypothetical protein
MAGWEDTLDTVETAADQAKQLEATYAADTGNSQATTPPASDSAKEPSKDWKDDVSKLGIDPGWVVALRKNLVEAGIIGMDEIQADRLADPEHAAYLNKLLKKYKGQKKAEAEPTPEATPTAPVPAGTSTKPPPSVLKPGHLPTEPHWTETPTAGAGGYIPAGGGTWWPPFPSTGGRVESATMPATAQADSLDPVTGEVKTGGQ